MKTKTYSIILFTISLILVVLGFSYGYYEIFIMNSTGSTMTVDIKQLSFDFADGNKITLNNLFPGTTVSKTFTVTNTGEATIYYDVGLKDVNNTLLGEDLVYTLTQLPSTYQEVEYIQSSGTQYIDTGYKLSSDNVIFESEWTEPILESGTTIWGSTNLNSSSNSNKWSAAHYHPSQGSLYSATGVSDGLLSQSNIVAGKRNKVKTIINSGSITKTQNGATIQGTYSGTVQNGVNISLFADLRSDGSVIEKSANLQMHSWILYDNGTMVRNMIPCYRKSDNVVGMYDTINGVFYTNSGTGSFIAGPSISETLMPISDKTLASKVAIAPGVTQTYIMNVTFKNLPIDQSYNYGKTFDAYIKIISPYELVTGSSTYVSDGELSSYVSDGLMLHYDAIQNTLSGHNTSTTTWYDLSGNGNNGTVSGATWDTNNLSFDGTNDYVSIGQLNQNLYTIEVVAKIDAIKSGEIYFIDNYDSGGYGLHLYNGYAGNQAYISGYKIAKSSILSSINTIYNYVGTYDGNSLKIYTNGKLNNSVVASGTIGVPGNTYMMVGVNPSGSSPSNGGFFNGDIYSVRIYNRALTDQEIKRNYENDVARFSMDRTGTD